MPLAAALTEFHRRLRAWYRTYGRHDLPWRHTADIYPLWVSEIMLQQTQVDTVRERYYAPFLRHFPTLEALAGADEQEVLKAWEGLGYYQRARNLHRAAQAAATQLPHDVEGLLALPGIGRNTAHAIASFAWNMPVPVMEANVKRIVHRVFALGAASETDLWRGAETLLDRARPADHNQAMMDLGALVCTVSAPRCGECPASGICLGKDNPLAYPAPARKKKPPVRRSAIVLFRDRTGRLYASPRPQRMLQGLYQFPEYESTTELIAFQGRRHTISPDMRIGSVQQVYSHFTLEAELYLMTLARATGEKKHWHAPEAFSRLPLSGLEHKILALLAKHRTKEIAACSA